MSWFSSPLMATIVVCAGIMVISVPLRRLTSEKNLPKISVAQSSFDDEHIHEIPGILRIKLLAPLESLRISTSDGELLWKAENLLVGEEEADVQLLLLDDALELRVEADFGDESHETALFLTVLPDGIEEQTHYLIGSGSLDEILHYEWDLH